MKEKKMSRNTFDMLLELRGLIITEIKDDDKMKRACELLEDYTYAVAEDGRKGLFK